jgi:hypothetical protein
MNVSALEGELSRAMGHKAQTSAALSEALAVKLAAEQRLNSILVSKGLRSFISSLLTGRLAAATHCSGHLSTAKLPGM